jgi:membrane protein required for colicin V production
MPDLPVNGLDLAVGVILLISALLAFMRGFVQEVLSIAAWVGAAFGALYGLPYVQPTARSMIPLDWAADAVAVVVLYLLILFALSLIINIISRTVQRSALNPLDRSLGFVFGVVRGAVVLCVALIITDWLVTRDRRPEWMRTAKTLPLMESGAESLKSLLPRSFQQAGDAAKDAAAKLEQAAETRRALERLTQPVPERGARERPGAEKNAGGAGTSAGANGDQIGKKVEEVLQNSTAKPQGVE